MSDPFNRTFSYLRLSLLPVCNFRCVYCLPNGNPQEALHQSHLTRDEIRRLLTAMAELGIEKVRLTGGEPTLRNDLLEIAALASGTPGVKKVALTTNGYRLQSLAPALKKTGVTSLNVSVDSLQRDPFFKITGQDRLEDVIAGVRAAARLDFDALKINVVVLKGLNDSEIDDFIAWSFSEPIHIRFIELMPTKDTAAFFQERHLDLSPLEQVLAQRGWEKEARDRIGGPAEIWRHPKATGRIGLIRPFSTNFCTTCNRLRITSRGELQLCLFGSGNYSLRPWLRDDGQKEELKHEVLVALGRKTASHQLHEGEYGTTRNLAAMGG